MHTLSPYAVETGNEATEVLYDTHFPSTYARWSISLSFNYSVSMIL